MSSPVVDLERLKAARDVSRKYKVVILILFGDSFFTALVLGHAATDSS